MSPIRPSQDAQVKQLYERFGPSIYSRCRRLLRDSVAAEDATQEVFLRVMRHLDRVPKDGTAMAWVSRISTNYCLNVLRDGQRHAEPVEHLPEQGGDDFEQELVTRNWAERLMGETPDVLRLPAQLYHLKGMEQAKVAKALGVSRRTVIYRLGEFAERARRFAERAEGGVS
ncbi:MAG: RNA polymerase sigma factor [Myxococcaceae bacterium]